MLAIVGEGENGGGGGGEWREGEGGTRGGMGLVRGGWLDVVPGWRKTAGVWSETERDSPAAKVQRAEPVSRSERQYSACAAAKLWRA